MDQPAAAGQDILQTAQDLRTSHTAAVAALAWLVYDVIITLDQEIKHIWRGRWTAAKVLYLSCRALGLYILLLDTIVGASANIPHRVCKATPALAYIGSQLLPICVNLIQLLRVKALFQGRVMILVPLWCLFLANTAISISLSAAIISTATVADPPLMGVILDGCLINYSRTKLMLGPYISSTVYRGVFFGVTLAKLYPYLRREEGSPHILTICARDGTMFFAVIFVTEILSLVWGQVFAHNRQSLENVVNVFRYAVYAIAGPRLILHLRGAVSQPSYADTVATGDTTYAHGPTTVDSWSMESPLRTEMTV